MVGGRLLPFHRLQREYPRSTYPLPTYQPVLPLQCSAYIAQDTTLKYYHDAIRLGNPNAFIGLNNGVHKIQGGVAWLNGGEKTQWEDMTAGETDSFNR